MTARDVRQELTTRPPEEQARLHLTAVLPPLLPTESIELRCLNTRLKPAVQGPRLFVTTIGEAVEFAMAQRTPWDVFFGVGTRICPSAPTMSRCPHQERGKDHVRRLGCIWGDFDTKSKSFDEILSELEGLNLPPTVLVGSGAGLHSYWTLDKPTADLKAVEALNRSLRVRFGADNAVDAARILRLAGTFNYKYGEPLPVQLVSCHGL